MVKTLSIEQKFYDRCLSQKLPNCGLIISGHLKDEECVFLLLSTAENKSTNNNNLDNVNIDHLRTECQKVRRMLPAGVRISGFYFCGTINPSQSSDRVKALLSVIHAADKHPLADTLITVPSLDRVFLHADPITKKLVAKAISFTQPKDFLRPINVKVRPTINRWRAIKTYIMLSVETHLPSERKKEKILKQLQDAVTPFLQTINTRTNLLVNGEARTETEELFLCISSKPTVKVPRHSKRNRDPISANLSSSEHGNTNEHWDLTTFTLFGPTFPCWQRTNSCSSLDSGHGSEAFSLPNDISLPEKDKNLLIHGRIPGLSFLPMEGTVVGEALEAFRRDLICSILLRMELLAEELHITSGEMEVSRILLPQRVLIRVPACPEIPLSDYKFISETPDDVVRRVAMFLRPLGSPSAAVRDQNLIGASDERLSGAADSGECSSDSDFNADSGEEVAGDTRTETEPLFSVSCLDTQLERTFEGSHEEELSDVDIITDIEEMAHSVSKSKGKILFFVTAIVGVLVSIILALYLDLWSM